jgi:uncharacterized protein YjiS (DUF1127 family)
MATELLGRAHGARAAGGRARGIERWLGRAVGGIGRRLVEWRRYRRTVNELATLTDRELEDIGLTRADIEPAARRCACLD